ncbi:MAG TPA: hypothetical protein VER04_12220, partial [Polyangiaceae bacterium]|nr:hypothetical protein [Polyangiaceae bacterium]
KQLWRKPLDSRATLLVNSVGPLVLQREDATFRVQIEQLELASGKSSWRAQAPAVQVGEVVSSPEVPWFSFETPEPNGRDTSVVLVTEGGRVRRFSADARSRECRPRAVWSQRESLASCEPIDELWAVDVVTSARRLLAKVPVGSFGHYLALSNGLVSLSGSGGVALLTADGQKVNLERSSGTADMTWPAVPLWSRDGQRASGVVKWGSREVVSVWDRKTKVVNAVWAGYAEAWPGHRTGFSLTKDRGAITFGDCPAAHRLDWRGKVLTTSAQSACGKPADVVHGELGAEARARAAAALGSEDTLRAVSESGARVAFETRQEVGGQVIRNLVVADLVDARLVARFQVRIHDHVALLFNRDASRLLFHVQGSQWQEADVQTGASKPASLGADLDLAVELSRDGATVLTANGLLNGSRRLLLPHASWKKAEDARADGLAFADDDRLIVARSADNILLWRTADAAYLGRLVTLASGDTFFTTSAPSQGGETGHVEPLQWWGPAQGPSSLRCELAGRSYDWQVCADRFSDDALLARALAR